MNSDDSSDNPTLLLSSTDTELFHALKAGQISALGILYDRYARLVYGLAFQMLKNPQEAEDLTQEVFWVLSRQATYNPACGLSSFLTTMTRSQAIDKLRSSNSSLKFLELWHRTIPAQTNTNTPFEQTSFAERFQKVQNALAQLSEEQRQVLAMFYYEGLRTEIAQRLKIPLETVKTPCRLGLLKLRQTLEDFMR